ncbi:MAG: hypothetical protein K8I82_30690 [Anaerolineae bacterium]|nr:hypothetical protein [Anaerolineae bacterium]
MRFRKNLASLMLIVSIILASYISIPTDNTLLSPAAPTKDSDHFFVSLIALLNSLELVHIGMHLLLFGIIAFLVGPWQGGSTTLAWSYVLVGSLLMETAQTLIGAWDDTLTELISSIVFDLLVNGVGGWIGIQAALQFERQRVIQWNARRRT